MPSPTATSADVSAPDIEPLVRLLSGRRLAVLTGAGVSTESGIPDYRGPETARRARNPIQHRAFLDDPETRRRYWARAALGWRRFVDARPNPAHHALAALERRGVVRGLVTQNVDRLHHRAGSVDVVELHGALADVRCLACGRVVDRETVQQGLEDLNPGWVARVAEMAPDGDAELPADAVRDFALVDCHGCGGPLKPNVVFFGDNVPRETVDAAYARVEAADALLVVGTSLAVFSGLRFVRRAHEQGRPVAIVNLGETRGDPFATVRVDGRAGDVLPRLADVLT